MLKIIFITVTILAWTFIPVSSQQISECYITINLVEKTESGWEYAGATSRDLCSANKTIYGIFYIGENQFGCGGGIVNNEKEVLFEIPYSFNVIEYPNEIILNGVIFSMNYSDGNTIESGNKKLVNKSIEPDKEIYIPAGKMKNNRLYGLGILISDDKPKIEEYDSPVSVTSSMYYKGVNKGVARNAKWSLDQITEFQTGTGFVNDQGYPGSMKYKIIISLSDTPTEKYDKLKTSLTIKRSYAIDTLYNKNEKFTDDLFFESKYSKDIILEHGKIFMLVIPPDTPPVHGFSVEDTLVFRP